MKKIETKLLIDGMTCANCEHMIEENLLKLKGVIKVNASFEKGQAIVLYYEDQIGIEEIKRKINASGYKTVDFSSERKLFGNTQGLYILAIIVGAYLILKNLGLLNFFNYIPKVQDTMGYGALFIVGLLTSIHCISMCGGINIAQSVHSVNSNKPSLNPNLLYNLGRVISYTLIGGIVGGIGSVISLDGKFRGLVAIIAGIFMVIMGLNMLNIFPWLRKLNVRMPRFISRRVYAQRATSNSSFYIGLFNGLMPCGPLQSMQLYALSTGSVLSGALSMLMFSLGTVPLMFGLGTISRKLNIRYLEKMLSVSAMLVVLLGIGMLNNGLSLSGVLVPQIQSADKEVEEELDIIIEDGYQIINNQLDYGAYPAIKVKAGIPVKWTLTAPRGRVNGCNDAIIIPEYDLTIPLYEGDNLIEFTPAESGQFVYSCWMGMINSSITVVN